MDCNVMAKRYRNIYRLDMPDLIIIFYISLVVMRAKFRALCHPVACGDSLNGERIKWADSSFECVWINTKITDKWRESVLFIVDVRIKGIMYFERWIDFDLSRCWRSRLTHCDFYI